MTMNLLRQSASSRLPVPSYRTVDIDQVRILRAAGLVVALIPSPSNLLTLSGDGLAARYWRSRKRGGKNWLGSTTRKLGHPCGRNACRGFSRSIVGPRGYPVSRPCHLDALGQRSSTSRGARG